MIRKLFAVTALSAFIAAAFLGGARIVSARINGGNTSTTRDNPDIVCFGGSNQGTAVTSTEVCLDYNGNWLPTTNNAQTSGSSASQWSDVEAKKLNSGGGSIAIGGQAGLYSRTLAQAQALVPLAAGAEIFCSDCSPAKILVATGTAAGNWADAVGSTFK